MDKKYIPSLVTIFEECKRLVTSLMPVNEAKKRVNAIKIDKTSPAFKKIGSSFKDNLKKLGKKQTIPTAKIAELNNKGEMPVMVKHCVIAVLPKLKGEGKAQSFIGAHNICMWSLDKYNLINGKTGKLTSRGSLREKFHRSTKDPIRNGMTGSQKTKKYNQLFNQVFKKAKK